MFGYREGRGQNMKTFQKKIVTNKALPYKLTVVESTVEMMREKIYYNRC